MLQKYLAFFYLSTDHVLLFGVFCYFISMYKMSVSLHMAVSGIGINNSSMQVQYNISET